MKAYKFELTLQEALYLDGHVSAEAQRVVDIAKATRALVVHGIEEPIARFVAEVVDEARTEQKLTFVRIRIRHCHVCGRDAGYAKHKRSGRTYRAGDTDSNHPLTMGGVELADRFVRLQGHATLGCCDECWARAQPLLPDALAGIRAEVPKGITGRDPQWRRWHLCRCKSCGWQGHEGELGELPAMISGYYRGKCPQCGAESRPFGERFVEHVSGYAVVATGEEDAA